MLMNPSAKIRRSGRPFVRRLAMLPLLLLAGISMLHAQSDWGDAPNTYLTTSAANGPRHVVSAALRIGDLVDAEADGLPGANALGDDTGGFDDEDGVVAYESPAQRILRFQAGAWTQLLVDVHRDASLANAFLNVWMDMNRDGDFLDVGERHITNAAANAGINELALFIPAATGPGDTFVRVRLSDIPLIIPFGPGGTGEVEDYRVTVSAPSPATNLQVWHRYGQTWVTWQFTPAAAAQTYEVYRFPGVPNGNPVAVSTGTLVARLFPDDYCGRRLVMQMVGVYGAASAPDNFTIPNQAGIPVMLPPDRGLCVDTVPPAGLPLRYYAVVPRGVTTAQVSAQSAQEGPAFFSAAVGLAPQPYLQYEEITPGTGAQKVAFYSFWSDGADAPVTERPDFPLMGNAARNSVAHHFIVTAPSSLPAEAGPQPLVLSCHGGTGNATHWMPGSDLWRLTGAHVSEGISVGLEDNIPQIRNGRPEAGNSRWLGWVRTWDPFENDPLRPGPEQQIQPYTLNRVNWVLSWLLQRSGLPVNPEKIALRGYSAGSVGAMLWACTSPQRFSHLTMFSPPLLHHDIPSNREAAFGTDAQNLIINGLTNSDGAPMRNSDMRSLTRCLAPGTDAPPTKIFGGKRDHWWAIDVEPNLTADLQQEIRAADTAAWARGVQLWWDMRGHGMEMWKLADAPAVGPGCLPLTAEDFWIPTQEAQTLRDDASAHFRYRRGQSYPGFYGFQEIIAQNVALGTVNYGTPPVPFHSSGDDSVTPYAGPNTDDCSPWLPEITGTNRGTWGGSIDWSTALTGDTALYDLPGLWACTAALVNGTDADGQAVAPLDNSADESLTARVAIRRPQLFQPVAGTPVTWMNVLRPSHRVVQSGVVTVPASGLVQFPAAPGAAAQLVIPRLPSSARIIAATEMDFGDAPAAYPVTLAQNGARHATDSVVRLGATRNLETEGTPHDTAQRAAENDDGVTGPALWSKESLVTLTITVNVACRLDAWVDWQRDGAWGGLLPLPAQDRIASALPLSAGANTLTLFVPLHAVPGSTVARFRVSLGGGLDPTGPAPEGEVEDWPIVIGPALLPTEPVIEFATNASNQRVVGWTGNPAYCSQFEFSTGLVDWRTLSIPMAEVSGTNEVVVPASLLAANSRAFLRLRRFPLVTSPVPVEAGYWSGANELSFVSSGLARKYRLRLPANWTPQRQWPLVMLLPGHSQSIAEFSQQRSEMFPLADGNDGDADPNDGWILCFAESLQGLTDHYWFPHDNPSTYTPPFTRSTQAWVDDFAFIKSLVQQFVASGLNIDPARIYAAGFSNGGNMCHYIASKADHPFAAFAMIESGVMFNTGLPDPATGARIYARTPLPAVPRPVLINNQVDSQAWIYEGWFNNAETTPGAAPSVGALNTVARWTVANFGTGTATWEPPTPTSPPSAFTFATPSPTDEQTPLWAPANPPLITPIDWVRPDTGWPAGLNALPGWTLQQALLVDYTIVPIPTALRNEYPRTIEPEDIPGPPFARMKTTAGTWKIKKWQTAPGDRTNEIVLVTIAAGAHFWPESDSPWEASVEVLKFFEAH